MHDLLNLGDSRGPLHLGEGLLVHVLLVLVLLALLLLPALVDARPLVVRGRDLEGRLNLSFMLPGILDKKCMYSLTKNVPFI